MPQKLKRYYGQGHLHFITFSCYRRMPLLGTVRGRNAFVHTLDEVRKKYAFLLVGYVVMPEHIHLLISEGKQANPSKIVQSLKLRVSKRMRRRLRSAASQKSFAFHDGGVPRFWQPRFYDFNVWSAKKRREKLEYMHRNPVTRKLVKDPKEWLWSSYSCYSGKGTQLLNINFVN